MNIMFFLPIVLRTPVYSVFNEHCYGCKTGIEIQRLLRYIKLAI